MTDLLCGSQRDTQRQAPWPAPAHLVTRTRARRKARRRSRRWVARVANREESPPYHGIGDIYGVRPTLIMPVPGAPDLRVTAASTPRIPPWTIPISAGPAGSSPAVTLLCRCWILMFVAGHSTSPSRRRRPRAQRRGSTSQPANRAGTPPPWPSRRMMCSILYISA